jgi:peptidoglycan/xylan/chitin deacetylase (PgdA/CDA1 family)
MTPRRWGLRRSLASPGFLEHQCLRNLVRELLSLPLRFSGLPWLIRRIGGTAGATIVVYHNPGTRAFRKHLDYLGRRYTFITLDALVRAIHARDWSLLPPRPLVVTIDDGHRGNVELLQIVREYAVRPTLYVCTRIVGSTRPFWFLAADPADKQRLKTMPNSERLALLRLQEAQDGQATALESERQALSHAEMRAMQADVDFESHTCSHPVLPTCSDAECGEEMLQSRLDLESLLGRPCRHFAYPHGDYTERECRIARDSGYLSARSIDLGWNRVDTDPYQLKVFGISDDASIHLLAVQLSGLPTYLRFLLKGSLRGRKRANTIRGSA